MHGPTMPAKPTPICDLLGLFVTPCQGDFQGATLTLHPGGHRDLEPAERQNQAAQGLHCFGAAGAVLALVQGVGPAADAAEGVLDEGPEARPWRCA